MSDETSTHQDIGHPARICGLPCRVTPLASGRSRVELAFGGTTTIRRGGLDALRSHGEYERLTSYQYSAWLARLGENPSEPIGQPIPTAP
jgi:hypothetical protein